MDSAEARLDYEAFLTAWHEADCAFIEAHTSGSTGTPKPVRLPKSDMLRSAQTMAATFSLDSGSVLSSALPLRSIATKMAIVRALACGGRYHAVQPSNTVELTETVTMLSVGPSQCDSLSARPALSARIDTLLVGGAPLSQEREAALLDAGYSVYETYGMTETCSNVALRHAPEKHFMANAGITFDTDSRGCLTVQAPGYSFDGLVTNDIVQLISPSEFVWTGRYDNAINSGGIKIHPEMLERELAPLIDVPFYVAGAPSRKWGCMAVVVIEGSEADADAARKALALYPDSIRRPKAVVRVTRFAHTPTGKIRRLTMAELQEML